MSTQLQAEIELGQRPDRPLRRWLRSIRAAIGARPLLLTAYRIGLAVLGGLIVVIGLILVPLPGPGWLIVFLGLAVLGTEFSWANRLAAVVKRALARFWTLWQAHRARRAARRTAARPAPRSGRDAEIFVSS